MKLGRAKNRINFLPKTGRRGVGSTVVVAAVAIEILLLPLSWAYVTKLRKAAEVDRAQQTQVLADFDRRLQEHISPATPAVSVAMQVQKARAEKLYWAEIFQELANIGPDRVWLTNLKATSEASQKKVVISGQGVSQADIAEFYARLEKSFYFRDLSIKFTESIRDLVPPTYRFEFEGVLHDPAPEVANGQN